MEMPLLHFCLLRPNEVLQILLLPLVLLHLAILFLLWMWLPPRHLLLPALALSSAPAKLGEGLEGKAERKD
jgi:hypothetical protein